MLEGDLSTCTAATGSVRAVCIVRVPLEKRGMRILRMLPIRPIGGTVGFTRAGIRIAVSALPKPRPENLTFRRRERRSLPRK
jgi:hypothetical protein